MSRPLLALTLHCPARCKVKIPFTWMWSLLIGYIKALFHDFVSPAAMARKGHSIPEMVHPSISQWMDKSITVQVSSVTGYWRLNSPHWKMHELSWTALNRAAKAIAGSSNPVFFKPFFLCPRLNKGQVKISRHTCIYIRKTAFITSLSICKYIFVFTNGK